MRYFLAVIVIAMSSGSLDAKEPELHPGLETQPISVNGTANEILRSAETCLAQILRFDAIRGIAGGAVLSSVNEHAGVVVANNRTSYYTLLNGQEFIQSTVTVLVKDGRFKIQHDNLRWMVDGSRGTEFLPIYAKAPFTKTATQTLDDISKKIGECIKGAMANKDW